MASVSSSDPVASVSSSVKWLLAPYNPQRPVAGESDVRLNSGSYLNPSKGDVLRCGRWHEQDDVRERWPSVTEMSLNVASYVFIIAFIALRRGRGGRSPSVGKPMEMTRFFHSLFNTSSREVLEVQATTC